MSSLSVREWYAYIPIFIDFSQLDSFISWVQTQMQELQEPLKEIGDAKEAAWISTDFSTRITKLRGKRDGFDFEVDINFRLRTLCFIIRAWKSKIATMQVRDAFEEMRKAEDEFKDFKKWDVESPTLNALIVNPFYEDAGDAKTWLVSHSQELNFFPSGCQSGYTFTLSLSKLIEQEEKLPLIATSLRNQKGVQEKLILLCGQAIRTDEPGSYFRARWTYFTSLLMHVLERATSCTVTVSEQMAKLEERVLKKSHESSKIEDVNAAIERLATLTEYSTLLFSLENDLALAVDDVNAAEKNLTLINRIAGTKGITEEEVKDEIIAGNASLIHTPKLTVGIGRGEPPTPVEPPSICNSGYFCILCEARKGQATFSETPPLNRGVVGETKDLIENLIVEFKREESEIMRSDGRVRSLISGLLSISSTQTNVQISLLHSQTALEQKTILAKVQNVLEESARDRRTTQEATRTVELLSLLFASFILGEISSNFIILGIEHVWPGGAPWWVYVAGFFLAVAIAFMIFLPVYLFYLRRKWKNRVKNDH